MADQMCNVRIDGEEKSYPCGTPFLEIVKDYQKNYKDDIVLVMFNRKLRELHKRLKKDGEISFVTAADNVGKKVYRRSVILLMQKAVYNLYGRKNVRARVLHSIRQGYFCKLTGGPELNEAVLLEIKEEMLRLAACLEEHYPHSMANAVVQAASAKGIRHDEMHSEVQYVVAHGIASQIGGEKAVIGSQHFVFEDEGCYIPTNECGKFDALPPEYSHLYLAIGGVLAGVICIADPLREEASEVLKQLRGLGIRKAVMMTGDNDRTASVIAKQVGVDHYYAEVLPEDKANFVEQEKAAGHTVIMLGDGINDSPALSAADVGIAISDGAAIAREIADVTIAADSLRELVILKSIANGLQKRTKSNYRFIMSFNSTLIVLGAMGILPPATSALLHNASTLGVSLKSMTNLLD